MKALTIVSSLAVATALSACATDQGSFAVVVATNQGQPLHVEEIRQVKGDTCNWWSVLGGGAVRGGDDEYSVEASLAEALSQAPGANALQNVKISQWTLLLGVYNGNCVIVEGMAVQIP